MSTKAHGITSGGVIKCGRVALIPASRGMRSTAGWALFHCVESGWHLVRALSDEIQSESRMREIRTSGLMSGERKRATASRPRTAPFLDSTGADDPVSGPVCVSGAGTRSSTDSPLCRHRASDSEWSIQQLREAFPWDSAPQYLLRDRDRIFGKEFVDQVKAMGIKQVLSAPRSPWQRAYVERVIGTIRRECLDHVIVFNERSLYRHLRDFIEYYHRTRTHLGLQKDTPEFRPV